MIRFSGTQYFPVSLEVVASRLSDASFLVRCVEGARISRADSDRAEFEVSPKFGFMSGSIAVQLEVVARYREHSATFHIDASAIGGKGKIAADLAFRQQGEGTAVTWTGEITERTGLVRMIPESMIQSAARKVIAETWAGIGKGLASPTDSAQSA